MQKIMHIGLYLLTLFIFAVMAISVYIFFDKESMLQKEYAYVINISGRQRMLSQYIAITAVEYQRNTSVESRNRLKDAITEITVANDYLMSLPNASAAIKRLYYSPIHVDSHIKKYILTAKNLIESDGDIDQYVESLAEQRHHLLNILNMVVQRYQFESESAISSLRNLQLVMLVLFFLVIMFQAFFIILPVFKRLSLYTRLADEDSLTGIYNRRAFMRAFDDEHERCLRYGHSYTLVMLDIDHFKKINDAYGHPAGDKVIRNIADIIRHEIRTNDIFGRVGGEEFAILLIGSKGKVAYQIVNKLQQAVSKSTTKIDGHIIQTTISAGIAICEPNFELPAKHSDKNAPSHIMLKRADEALYLAKNGGRNQAHLWQ